MHLQPLSVGPFFRKSIHLEFSNICSAVVLMAQICGFDGIAIHQGHFGTKCYSRKCGNEQVNNGRSDTPGTDDQQ